VASVAEQRTFIVGTRGSRLALAQTRLVVDALRAAHPGARFDVREITSQGDRDTKPLSEIGGLGVFTKALEDALLVSEIDIAIHSMKDLPPVLTAGLTIAAVPERASALDALVTKDGLRLEELPAGARLGTGSGRRAAQVRAMRPDVAVLEIRGNVPTRIQKVDDGEFDGVILAVAGLTRLDLVDRIAQTFTVREMTPSPGQGALAIEVRAEDAEAIALVTPLDHLASRAAVTAERALLAELGAGCKTPIGAHAEVEGNAVQLAVAVAAGPDRVEWLRTSLSNAGQMSRGGRHQSDTEILLGIAERTGKHAAQTIRDAGWLTDGEERREH